MMDGELLSASAGKAGTTPHRARDAAAELAAAEEKIAALEARNRLLETAIGKLEEVDRIKKNFLLMASHQMRSPLVAIQSVIKAIVSGAVAGNDEAVRSLLGQAYNRSEDMLGMVNDILNLAEAKVERDEGVEETDPAAEMNSVVAILRPVGAEKKVEIQLQADEDLPRIKIARKSLNHIFTNLVENAVKYSKDETTVKVTLAREGGGIRLEVRDQGIGIPADAREKIFKEFYRADNARMIQKQGTGLGLAIVQNIVQNFGGDISFESKENEGTKFTVLLPPEPNPNPAEQG